MCRNSRLLLSALVAIATTLPNAAQAGAVSTVTTLALSSPSVASPAPVTLTASVTAGGAPVANGSVTFCDAAAHYCEDAAIVGKAQLIAGTAKFKFIPAIGTHSYKAVFSATSTAATSSSTAQTLTVSGLYPTTTAIAATGNPSGYQLTATVVGFATIHRYSLALCLFRTQPMATSFWEPRPSAHPRPRGASPRRPIRPSQHRQPTGSRWRG